MAMNRWVQNYLSKTPKSQWEHPLERTVLLNTSEYSVFFQQNKGSQGELNDLISLKSVIWPCNYWTKRTPNIKKEWPRHWKSCVITAPARAKDKKRHIQDKNKNHIYFQPHVIFSFSCPRLFMSYQIRLLIREKKRKIREAKKYFVFRNKTIIKYLLCVYGTVCKTKKTMPENSNSFRDQDTQA